jgi:hypothetical protein
MNFVINVGGDVCLLSDCDILLGNNMYKNITDLKVGDNVMGYFSNKSCKIVDIIKNTHQVSSLQNTNIPYLIRKSALDENVPSKDIHISGHHRLIIRTIENEFIGIQAFKLDIATPDFDKTNDTVTYYHLRLDNPNEGVIVNNLPVESYQED